MQRIIRDEFQDRTIIAIAHRLDTILDFDRVAVLHMGELLECDTPGNLLGRDSIFKRLCESNGVDMDAEAEISANITSNASLGHASGNTSNAKLSSETQVIP